MKAQKPENTMQTIQQRGITYQVQTVRPTPIAGREMLLLTQGAGTVRYIAFRDANGYVSQITRSLMQ
jgi:hypothetical protein